MLLQSTWFFLWGLLWAVFFMTDGFDMGIGTLYPFLGKSERDKNMMIHAMGPLWDGNEVWLLTAGGVTFAAFPLVYATMFSSLYSALMLILFALILRGVSFEFRNKVESAAWKKIWDGCIFVGSFLPALLFGVAFGNIFQGIPVDGDGVYHGTLFTLLNPYGLLAGVLFVCLFVMHGALWLGLRSDGDLRERAKQVAARLWPVLTGVAVVFLIATIFFTRLYDNYLACPVLFVVPALAVAGLAGILLFLIRHAFFKAWLSSALTIVSCTFFGVIGLFPNMFPSSIDEAYNLTAFNASSSPLTLKIMLIVVVIFIPVVLAYQAWAYKLFSGKVTDAEMASEETY
ncbi:cytochrome d ubiquinol oxidase subunit II [Desulfosarcina sp. OttesenSCG-928-A07]|nr:cytochrome d ubiquinol oxidase subunit II [Desulfosarcina sp. OttesenSCG-928-G17]MDL2329760.1 cytochrome d ubiquinol oxidase subunit II [Desulfosarcina sp. OttesenSCG-928-A07]